MKKWLFFLLFAGLCLPGSAQKKNSLRTGVGLSFINESTTGGYSLSVGPAMFLEYNRRINDWLGITGGGFSSSNTYGESGQRNINTEWNVSAKAIFTPFNKHFRYFKAGGGVSWSNSAYYVKYVSNFGYARIVQNNFGLDLAAQLYLIDNERFELFGTYGLSFWPRSYPGGYWRDIAGLFFGVKF